MIEQICNVLYSIVIFNMGPLGPARGEAPAHVGLTNVSQPPRGHMQVSNVLHMHELRKGLFPSESAASRGQILRARPDPEDNVRQSDMLESILTSILALNSNRIMQVAQMGSGT